MERSSRPASALQVPRPVRPFVVGHRTAGVGLVVELHHDDVGADGHLAVLHQLLARAAENNASDRVLADLRRLPDGKFENVQDVARALGLGTEQQRF